jgi:hypothetical protein
METEEQRATRLKAALYVSRTADLDGFLGFDAGIDAEAELSRIMSEEIDKEIVKSLKRMVNNVPTVSDRIKPIR